MLLSMYCSPIYAAVKMVPTQSCPHPFNRCCVWCGLPAGIWSGDLVLCPHETFVFLFLWYDRLFAVHILFKFPCKQSKIKVFSFLQTLMEIRRDAVELGISQNV